MGQDFHPLANAHAERTKKEDVPILTHPLNICYYVNFCPLRLYL